MFTFEDDYKQSMKEHLEDLEAQASQLSREERIQLTEQLTDDYVAHTGRRPDGPILERLANLVLHEELTDPRPDKMTLEEYPIMSDHQYGRRTTGSQQFRNSSGVVRYEVPLEQGVNVATDGVDYTPHTRTYKNPRR